MANGCDRESARAGRPAGDAHRGDPEAGCMYVRDDDDDATTREAPMIC
jgi:hypothetical protein